MKRRLSLIIMCGAVTGCASVTYQSAGPARVRLDPADKQSVQVLDSEGKVRCQVKGRGPVVVEPAK